MTTDQQRQAMTITLPPLPDPENYPWKCGDEFLPYHPSASHVDPDYRDGWNACYKTATEWVCKQMEAQLAAAIQEDRARRGEVVTLVEKVRFILSGIDENDSQINGWWETNGGADWGAGKLQEVIAAIEQHGAVPPDTQAVLQRCVAAMQYAQDMTYDTPAYSELEDAIADARSLLDGGKL